MSEKEKGLSRFLPSNKTLFAVIGISVAVHLLGGLIFGGYVMIKLLKPEEVVLAAPEPVVGIEPEKREYKVKLEKSQKQSANPMPLPIAVDMPSDVSLADFEITVNDTKGKVRVNGRGDGDGFGNGFGGSSGGGFETNFFGLSGVGNRIAFIVDYSLSMKGDRSAIMRHELKRSLNNLPETVLVTVVFFAGPAWLATDRIESNTKRWAKDWGYKKGATDFKLLPGGKLPTAEWLQPDAKTLTHLTNRVRRTPLVWGTVWDFPFQVVFNMEDLPDVIFFMTDGSCDRSRGVNAVRKMYKQLEGKKPIINTIGFELEGSGRNALRSIANMSGGEFKDVRVKDFKKIPSATDAQIEKKVFKEL